MVCEDDIQFLDPELFKTQLNAFLKNHPDDWDVVLLAGNNMPPFEQIDDTCVKVSSCQTTTGYLVNGHYFDKLIENFRTGIKKLISFPDQHIIYAIDKFWFALQKQDSWYLIIPLSIVQKEDYSDIEKKVTNFKQYMLNYNKAYKK